MFRPVEGAKGALDIVEPRTMPYDFLETVPNASHPEVIDKADPPLPLAADGERVRDLTNPSYSSG